MIQKYKSLPEPLDLTIPAVVERIKEIIDSDIKLDSSPGYPYMRMAKTNSELFALVGKDTIASYAAVRFANIMATSLSDIATMTADELVAANLCDPVRFFVKNELHSRLKVEQGRYRLISSVSVVDSIIERVLNRDLNNFEIDNWQHIPSKPGMGNHDDGLIDLSLCFTSFTSPTGSDVSGFDWCTNSWCHEDDAIRRARLCHSDPDPWLKRASLLTRSLVVLSDGSMFAQTDPGVQKSGAYTTSSTNSAVRTIICHHAHLRVGGAPLDKVRNAAMGDDCVEDTHHYDDAQMEKLAEAYAQLGFPLKAVERDSFEFCAYWYSNGVYSHPTRTQKMLMNFLWRWAQPGLFNEKLADLSAELRHDPDREEIISALLEFAQLT